MDFQGTIGSSNESDIKIGRKEEGGKQMNMTRDIVSLSQDLCMLWGESTRSDMRLGIPQDHYQWWCYDLECGIALTACPILEVVADMPLQSSLQWVRTFQRHEKFLEVN